MANYFISYCSSPIYLLNSVQEAENCGLINGIVYAFIISLVLGYFIGKAYFSTNNSKSKNQILLFAIIVIGLVWLITPSLVKNGYRNIWDGYNNIIATMLNLGYTRVEAISILQNPTNTSDLNVGIIQAAEESSLVTATSNPHYNKKATFTPSTH